jgi:hypothetical protein
MVVLWACLNEVGVAYEACHTPAARPLPTPLIPPIDVEDPLAPANSLANGRSQAVTQV